MFVCLYGKVSSDPAGHLPCKPKMFWQTLRCSGPLVDCRCRVLNGLLLFEGARKCCWRKGYCEEKMEVRGLRMCTLFLTALQVKDERSRQLLTAASYPYKSTFQDAAPCMQASSTLIPYICTIVANRCLIGCDCTLRSGFVFGGAF